jgi:hypothetical protein
MDEFISSCHADLFACHSERSEESASEIGEGKKGFFVDLAGELANV